MDKLETINRFTLTPWENHGQTVTSELMTTRRNVDYDIRIRGSRARNGVTAVGGAATRWRLYTAAQSLRSSTLSPRSEQDPYPGEFAAMERALGTMSALRSSRIGLSTRNKAAILAIRQARGQSGQQRICHIAG